MIFRPELVKKIGAGTKTMTRRPVNAPHCRYRLNHVYSVQPGRGKPGTIQITITEVREERLGDLSLRDAKREGFRTTQDFIDYWRGLYGSYDAEQMVWVISFVKGDATDTPRLLAARPGGPGGDYTANPARAAKGEPEAISVRLQERYAREGEERDKSRLGELRSRALAAIGAIEPHASGKDFKRLRAAANQIRSLGPSLPSDEDVSSRVTG